MSDLRALTLIINSITHRTVKEYLIRIVFFFFFFPNCVLKTMFATYGKDQENIQKTCCQILVID